MHARLGSIWTEYGLCGVWMSRCELTNKHLVHVRLVLLAGRLLTR